MTEEEQRLSELLSERGRLKLEALRVDNTITAALSGVLRQKACRLRDQLNQVEQDISRLTFRLSQRRPVVFGEPEETCGIWTRGRGGY